MAGMTTFLARTGYDRAMDVVYLDELFALNAIIDYLLLRLAAALAGLPARRGRAALGGVLGGAYAAAALLFPGSPLLTPAGKLAASGVMCLVAWGWGRRWARGYAAFLAVSALFAGAVCAAALLAGQRASPGSLPARISLRLLGVCFGVCYALVRFFLWRFPPAGAVLELELRLGERRLALRALRDTGNSLSDPVSGCAVLIAGGEAVSPLLGDALPLPVPEDASELFLALARDPLLSRRLGLIPYAGVGREGLLVTVRPDGAVLAGAPVRLILAVSPTPIGSGEYEAVL